MKIGNPFQPISDGTKNYIVDVKCERSLSSDWYAEPQGIGETFWQFHNNQVSNRLICYKKISDIT